MSAAGLAYSHDAQPMSLANMRANGVHALAVWCDGLGRHHRVLDVSGYPDDVPVPAFGPRMVCTVCGAIGADARPNWNGRAPASLYGPPRRHKSHTPSYTQAT
jgi:hypothetical protein